jgi:Holliday junction resolvase RusA-like endonuclease
VGRRILCEVWVPGEPVPKARPRLNRKTGGVYTPPRTITAQLAFGYAAKAARLGCRPEPDHHIAVDLGFYRGKGQGDIDNLVKLALDACNGVLWTDDRQVCQLRAIIVHGAAEPGTRMLAYVCEEVLA